MLIKECTFRVIDTETTGLDPKTAGICEIAWADCKMDGVILSDFSQLLDPGHPIPPSASAVHHIVDDDVRGMPGYDYFMNSSLEEGTPRVAPDGVYVAHNADFDKGFTKLPGLWLCTMRMVQHLAPDLESFKNDAIRYAWKLSVGLKKDTASHRAANDVRVTAAILAEALRRAREAWPEITAVEQLHAKIQGPILLHRVPFSGKPLFKDADIGLLRWIVSKSAGGKDCVATAKAEIARRAGR